MVVDRRRRAGSGRWPTPMADHNDQSLTILELAELAGGLAHEIRNPLSTLKVNLQLLAEDIRDPQNDDIDAGFRRRALKRLDTLQDETSRLQRLLDEFLRVVGRHELNCHPGDLTAIVSEAIEFFGPQAQAQNVELHSTVDDGPLMCLLDRNWIKQALLNLMINALQAMPTGGRLDLACGRAGGDAYLEVADSGMGIEPDVVERIFAPFFSTKKEGSGLGLSLTRRIVLEHGGDISVDSTPQNGSRFRITLPLISDSK